MFARHFMLTVRFNTVLGYTVLIRCRARAAHISRTRIREMVGSLLRFPFDRYTLKRVSVSTTPRAGRVCTALSRALVVFSPLPKRINNPLKPYGFTVKPYGFIRL